MKKNIIKFIPLFGIFSAIFYFLHVILGEIFYKGYNPLAQAISDLTASNSPSKGIARIFSMLHGISALIFSIGLFLNLKGRINKVITCSSLFFCAMNAISFFGYTLFPLSESGYAGTAQDRMHILVTIFVVAFTIISLILFCIGFLRTGKYKHLGIISLCAFILLAIGAILVNIVPKEYFGAAERINIYSVIIYTCVLSIMI
jgi:hypothetical membrane protein